MSASENPYEPPQASASGDTTIAAETSSGEASTQAATPEPRWGFWATVGFSLLVLAAFVGLQTIVAVAFIVVQVVVNGGTLNAADAESLTSNGLLLSLATFVAMPAALALVVLFASLKPGATVRGYLGLRGVTLGVGAAWVGVWLIYALATDGLTYLLGRPVVPEFMVDAYQTAGFVPLLWLALVVAAPVFEEAFFRGFMLEGFRQSRLGPVGAVLLTSFAWAAIHLQYDVYQVAVIFFGGLLFGAAKIQTGSVLLTMIMHALQNVLANAETAISVHLNAAG